MPYSLTQSRIISALILISALLVFPVQAQALGGTDIPPLDEFIEEVMNGEADTLRGVYVAGVLADSVTSQPAERPAYVSSKQDTLTQFGLASQFDSTGLLAHNFLAGKSFSLLDRGQLIYLIYGDGRTESFIITQFMRFRALTPNSVTSNFIDLDDGEFFTASKLFLEVYNRPGNVVLQTCINAFGNNSWGRLFIIAEPYDPTLSIQTSIGERDDPALSIGKINDESGVLRVISI